MNLVSPAGLVTIRPMRAADLEQVHAIERHSFSSPWPLRSYQFELERNTAARLWVAEIETSDGSHRLVGMVVVWLLQDEAHIANIAVDRDHRRQGVACRLLKTALWNSLREGARQATLEVRAGNCSAQSLYRRFGFEVVGRRPRYYHDNREDALLMTLPQLDALQMEAQECSANAR